MHIKVVVPGKYLDKKNKARFYGKNDVLVTSEWYAKSLLKDGFVREYTPRKSNKKAKIEDVKKEQPRKRKRRKAITPDITAKNSFSESND